MKTYKIFPASSRECNEERLILPELVHKLNLRLYALDVQLQLEPWEFQDASMGAAFKQEEYNAVLSRCEIVLVFFKSVAGSYTIGEAELALKSNRQKAMPKFVGLYYDKSCSSAAVSDELSDLQGKFRITPYGFVGHDEFANKINNDLVAFLESDLGKSIPEESSFDSFSLNKIGIYLSIPKGLESERLAFYALVEQLNRQLESSGSKIIVDESPLGYKRNEIAVAVYWNDIGSFDHDCISEAYKLLCQGENPRKFYVYFKEPALSHDPETEKFKAGFEREFGHFCCRFEHVDSFRLQFAFQLAEYGSGCSSNDMTVAGTDVLFCGRKLCALENLPFVAKNAKMHRLLRKVKEAEKELASLKKQLDGNAGDLDLNEELNEIKGEIRSNKSEIEKFSKSLLDIARCFAQQSSSIVDGRILKAKELFEQGKAAEADRLLDENFLAKQENQDAISFNEAKAARLRNVQAYLLKARTTMASEDYPSFDSMVGAAISYYERALSIAKEINLEPVPQIVARCEFARFLAWIGKWDKCINAVEKITDDFLSIPDSCLEEVAPYLVEAYGNAGIGENNLGNYSKAYIWIVKAEEMTKFCHNPGRFMQMTICSLSSCRAKLLNIEGKYEEAWRMQSSAYETYEKFRMEDVNHEDVNVFNGVMASLSGMAQSLEMIGTNEIDRIEAVYSEMGNVCSQYDESCGLEPMKWGAISTIGLMDIDRVARKPQEDLRTGIECAKDYIENIEILVDGQVDKTTYPDILANLYRAVAENYMVLEEWEMVEDYLKRYYEIVRANDLSIGVIQQARIKIGLIDGLMADGDFARAFYWLDQTQRTLYNIIESTHTYNAAYFRMCALLREGYVAVQLQQPLIALGFANAALSMTHVFTENEQLTKNFPGVWLEVLGCLTVKFMSYVILNDPKLNAVCKKLEPVINRLLKSSNNRDVENAQKIKENIKDCSSQNLLSIILLWPCRYFYKKRRMRHDQIRWRRFMQRVEMIGEEEREPFNDAK